MHCLPGFTCRQCEICDPVYTLWCSGIGQVDDKQYAAWVSLGWMVSGWPETGGKLRQAEAVTTASQLLTVTRKTEAGLHTNA